MYPQYKWYKSPVLGAFERPIDRRILWDTNKPMLSYIDSPDMSFTDYVVYCGGLLGLWFGQSLKDIILLSIDWFKIIATKILIYFYYCTFNY